MTRLATKKVLAASGLVACKMPKVFSECPKIDVFCLTSDHVTCCPYGTLVYTTHTMIGDALQFTCRVLNQFIRNRFGLDENKVLLNNLIEGNGTLPQINQNKIVLSLINIEKETAKPFYTSQQAGGKNFTDIPPAQRFNLDLLISANFDDYQEALKFLNEVILFFQAYPSVEAALSSDIPAGLHKLEFEVEKISYHQMQSLWTAMGAKYQPSIIYKVRLITIQAHEAKGFVPFISRNANTATV